MVQNGVIAFESLVNPDDWAKTSSRKDCSMCLTKFTTFKRRHHCRVCGDIVCSTCFIKRKASIPMVGIIDIKVCTSCANNESSQQHSRRPMAKSSSSDGCVSASFEARSTFSEDRASNFFKSSQVSDSSSTYSSSIFSSTSLNLGHSPDNQISSFDEGAFGEESLIDGDCGSRDARDLHAEWLKEENLVPLRQLSEPTACYDIWVMRHQEGEQLVSKKLNADHATPESVEQFVDVVELVAQLRHPHILEFVGVAWTAERRIQALYEYLPRGDLRTFLDATAQNAKTRQKRSRSKLQMALDIAEALVHIHSFSPPIVHGSLDSGEVLVTKDYRAKLGGIGATSFDRTGKKTRRWQAPEVVSNSGVYLPSSDVYAFGVILCELDTHLIPYADCLDAHGESLAEEDIEQLVAQGELQPTISRDCPPELRQLASDCMAFDPTDRPTAVEITVRLHMFIRSYGLESHARGDGKKSVELYDLGLTGSARARHAGLTF